MVFLSPLRFAYLGGIILKSKRRRLPAINRCHNFTADGHQQIDSIEQVSNIIQSIKIDPYWVYGSSYNLWFVDIEQVNTLPPRVEKLKPGLKRHEETIVTSPRKNNGDD